MVLMSRCVVTAVFFLLEGWLDEFEDFPKELSRSHMGRLAESEFEAVAFASKLQSNISGSYRFSLEFCL